MDKPIRNRPTKLAREKQMQEEKRCVSCGKQDERTMKGLRQCEACTENRRRQRAIRNGLPPEKYGIKPVKPNPMVAKALPKNFRIAWPPAE